MAVSSSTPVPAALRERVTDIVKAWMDDEERRTFASPFAEQCNPDGPHRAALQAEDLDQAAEALRRWFVDHLARCRTATSPLDSLVGELAAVSLSLVDWMDIADDIRD